MASRYRSISTPTLAFLRSSTRPTLPKTNPLHPHSSPSLSPFSRMQSGVRCVCSLLPLHSAVSAARLTSCLGADSRVSRSLSQGMLYQLGLSVPR